MVTAPSILREDTKFMVGGTGLGWGLALGMRNPLSTSKINNQIPRRRSPHLEIVVGVVTVGGEAETSADRLVHIQNVCHVVPAV